jgi:hypothetical protein
MKKPTLILISPVKQMPLTTVIYLISVVFMLRTFHVFSQQDTTKNTFSLSTYLETYYAYDFGNPPDHTRPSFIYSYNRHNEVNLNLGFIKAEHITHNTRANLALMAGTYSNANLSSEPGVFKNIFEANMGIKLSKTKNLWVDAGIFASHIGFESAIGKDCWNVSRSILADNSPYYESGIKVSYTNNNEKWFLSALVLNGWQRIYRINDNNTPAFGHQITYKPSSGITLNSSSFVGNVLPDSIQKMRYFHNFYGQFQITEKTGIITGFDTGIQQTAKNSEKYAVWYSPVLVVRHAVSEKIYLAVRGEYYTDPQQVMIETNTPNGFQTFGYSLNFDYWISKNALWRIEGRGFMSKDKVFVTNKQPSSQNYFVLTSIAVYLNKMPF